MTNRRRRWLRRLAIAVSLAAFAAPAAAKPVPAASGGVIGSLSSRAILDGALAPQQAAPVRPDDRADRSLGTHQSQLAGNVVRPDDRADRFAISSVSQASAPGVDSSVSWDGAVTLGLGTLLLVLAFGLGIGYVRRPRIAGL